MGGGNQKAVHECIHEYTNEDLTVVIRVFVFLFVDGWLQDVFNP